MKRYTEEFRRKAFKGTMAKDFAVDLAVGLPVVGLVTLVLILIRLVQGAP